MQFVLRARLVTLAVVVAVTATLVETSVAAASDTTTDVELTSQCVGNGFVSAAGDAKTAADLMAGKLTIPGFATVPLAQTPTWRENPFNDRNWSYQYQSLRWTDTLRREAVRTNDGAMLARYEDLLKSWLAANPFNGRAHEDPMAWYDMGIGVRAMALSCANQVAGGEPWLTQAMSAHAAALIDPTVYRTTGNHGLNQDIGLLALGCVTDTEAWKSLALSRTAALAARSIDEQGVTDEGSSSYQQLNFYWYRQIRKQIQDCGLEPPAVLDRIELMPDFLAQATMPNGQLVGLGDSNPMAKPGIMSDTTEQYAATLGADGIRPTKTFSVYKRGYLFSRATWNPQSPNSSFLSLRFGQSRHEQVHGHDDATDVTFYALGKELLWNDGLFGGAGGPFRTYVTSRAAQNTVDVPSVAYDRDAHSTLVKSKTTTNYDVATVVSPTLTGVITRRTVVHAKQGGFLVVDDQVTQAKSRTVVQRWQLEEDRKTVIHAGRVATTGSGTNSVLLWVGTTPHLHVIKGQTKPSVDGWRSDHSGSITPSPTAEASVNGKHVRLTMILIPRAAHVASVNLRITGYHATASTRQFNVHTGSGTYHVTLTSTAASVVKL